MKTLYAFDMDDTLLVSNSKVLVKNIGTGIVATMTPAEYAVYEEKPGDKFDFSEFDRLNEPEIIKTNFDLFSSILKKTSRSSSAKTIILTARTPKIKKDVEEFIKTQGLPPLTIHAVESSNPQAKVNIIQDYVDAGYDRVRFYDDSRKNVAAVNAMKTDNSGVDIQAKLVISH
jgi:hypothetical protein